MKRVISISLLAIMLCLFLTGCTQNVKNETITNTNEDKLIIIIQNNKKLYLQRFYG